MNMNNFTIKSQEAIQEAQQLTVQNGQQQIEISHISKAILKVDENVSPYILKKSGINLENLSNFLDQKIESFSKVSGGNISLSREANTVISNAVAIANKMKDEFVAIEHLWLAIFENKNAVSQYLKEQGLKQNQIQAAIEEIRQGDNVKSQSA